MIIFTASFALAADKQYTDKGTASQRLRIVKFLFSKPIKGIPRSVDESLEIHPLSS
jgi:hypothetical protein